MPAGISVPIEVPCPRRRRGQWRLAARSARVRAHQSADWWARTHLPRKRSFFRRTRRRKKARNSARIPGKFNSMLICFAPEGAKFCEAKARGARLGALWRAFCWWAAKLCGAFGAGLFFGFFEVFAVALFVEGIACAVDFARCAAQEAAVRAAVAPARVVRDPAGAADAVPHVDVEA